jgi:hypothetical protein
MVRLVALAVAVLETKEFLVVLETLAHILQ